MEEWSYRKIIHSFKPNRLFSVFYTHFMGFRHSELERCKTMSMRETGGEGTQIIWPTKVTEETKEKGKP